MRLSKCWLVLVFSFAAVWRYSSQNVHPKEDAQDAPSKIAGVWRGHSECAVKNSPCHDEVNVYRFSKIAGDANKFSLTAGKVVDAKEVVMGTSACRYKEKDQIVECEKPSIQLAIHGDKMEGTLKLEDGTAYRRIYLKKES